MEASLKNNVFLDQDQLEFRDYQLSIAKKCVSKNSLVVVPTGLGKTIIGLFVAAETLTLFPKDSKILVLAPTRPLINQHYETFLKLLTIPEEKFCVLTGKISPNDRPEMFEENQIIFATPQTIRNDIVKKKYSLEKV
ncbi:MAG: DEAD/DEAH box helicase family protein, partial [Candidatus Lokiarchaeota archaeon]